MSILDHYLIKLSLKREMNRRPQKKRFMFEAMWIRDLCLRVGIGENLAIESNNKTKERVAPTS